MRFVTIYCFTKYVYVSPELHGHASSHCSSLWYEKGIAYQQIIKLVGIKPLNPPSLKSFVYGSIQVIELHELFNVWAKAIFHGFPKRRYLRRLY